jgi:hypothetical protein
MTFTAGLRNVYTHNFLPEKMKPLVEKIDDIYSKLKEQLKKFCNFLENI